MAFKIASDADSDGTVEEFTITNTLKKGVKTSNKAEKISEGSSYSAILTGVSAGDTVAVTMGGTAVTSTAYNSTNKTINIDSVTGNIVVTVS